MLNWLVKRRRTFAPALAAIALASSVVAAGAANVLVRGSTTLFPFTQRIANELWPYGPGDPAVTASIGSGAGLNELCRGLIDVAPSSSTLVSLVPANCTGLAYGQEDVEDWLVARDALSPIVQTASLDGVVTDLTRNQLRDIYNCTLNNWNQIFPSGGSRPIFVVAREITSGTYQSWLDLIGLPGPAGRTAEQNCLTLRESQGLGIRGNGNEGVRTEVAARANAVGYVGLGFLPFAGVTQKPVEGVLGTPATVENGSYVISRNLYYFILKRNSNPAYPRPDTFGLAYQFLSRTVNASGQNIVAQEGYIPLSAPRALPSCDVNVDFSCNILDIAAIGARFQPPPFTAGRFREDTNTDGNVNILDIVVVGQNFGLGWSKWTN